MAAWRGNVVWPRGMVVYETYEGLLWYPCKDKSGTIDFTKKFVQNGIRRALSISLCTLLLEMI